MSPRRFLAACALALGTVVLSFDLAAAVVPHHPAGAISARVLSFSCHQRAERCFRVGDRPLGACARCVGIHAAGLLGGLLLLSGARWLSALTPRRWLAIAGVPMGVDVALGLISSGWDHPWLRAATGLVAGVALLAAAADRMAPLHGATPSRID